MEQLTNECINASDGPALPFLAIHLELTRISSSDHDEIIYLGARPVDAPNVWKAITDLFAGRIFRKIHR